MGIQIEIGRTVSGEFAFRVPETYMKVSRLHAILQWNDGRAILEDRSSNGTFVNGRRITKAQIQENDIVLLGDTGVDKYQLDVRQLFSICRDAEKRLRVDNTRQVYGSGNGYQGGGYGQPGNIPQSNPGRVAPNPQSGNSERTDYSREFEQVKQAYIGYHEKMSKLTKKANTRMQMPRLLLSLIPTVIGLVIMIVATDMTMRIVGMSAGTVLSGLIGVLTMGSGSSKKEKLNEEMLDLKLKYQKDYRCPKCGKNYSLDMHWKQLQADGNCPYGCGAQFN